MSTSAVLAGMHRSAAAAPMNVRFSDNSPRRTRIVETAAAGCGAIESGIDQKTSVVVSEASGGGPPVNLEMATSNRARGGRFSQQWPPR
jgi:hypothetical protein